MTDFLNDWGLTLVTFVPLVGALVMMAVPSAEEKALKQLALLSSLLAMVIGGLLLIDFDYGNAGALQYVVDARWIEVINSRYILGLDGISLPLMALTLVVVPLCVVYSWDHIPEPGNPKAFFVLMLILETGMVGTFVAQDLILFFVFFEVVLLPMFFMIAVWGGENRRYASIKFFLFTLFGSALMLLSFLALFFLSTDPATGESLRTFDMRVLSDVAGAGILGSTQIWIFAGMFIGFGGEGADVPVPHLAARRPYRGAHGGIGDPGRDPVEARHLRVRAHRGAHAARRRGDVGAVDRAAGRDRPSSTARWDVWPRPT